MLEDKERHKWTLIDIVIDMLWNVFSVSSRVIALALFASYQLYWFWGIVGVQFAIGALFFGGIFIFKEGGCSQCEDLLVNLFVGLPMGLSMGLFISVGNVLIIIIITFIPIKLVYNSNTSCSFVYNVDRKRTFPENYTFCLPWQWEASVKVVCSTQQT